MAYSLKITAKGATRVSVLLSNGAQATIFPGDNQRFEISDEVTAEITQEDMPLPEAVDEQEAP
jgi:hypothetical protein